MPCLNLSTNVSLEGVDTSSILSQASSTVAKIIGKPEPVSGRCPEPHEGRPPLDPARSPGSGTPARGAAPLTPAWFGPTSLSPKTEQPAAYGELVSIGGLSPDVNKKLSGAIANILETKLSVPKSRFYLEFYDTKAIKAEPFNLFMKMALSCSSFLIAFLCLFRPVRVKKMLNVYMLYTRFQLGLEWSDLLGVLPLIFSHLVYSRNRHGSKLLPRHPPITNQPAPTISADTHQLPSSSSSSALRSFFSGISETVRSGLANRRPWPELLDRSAFSKPESLSEATLRIRKNYNYFRINYLAVISAVLAVSLLTNPFSLILLAALLASWLFLYLFRQSSDPPLTVFGRQFSDRETLLFLIVSTIVVIFLTSVGSILVSAFMVGIGIVCLHGALRTPKIFSLMSRRRREALQASSLSSPLVPPPLLSPRGC
ncbi:UNVERIFIED_CONTAM: PRA1 family protein B4 [Sesamum latifolium]|uniref:PRA1 family protein B4 n=1 Tax=Sesamum latifolium TaxID=2727402 RepID=A0AAW2VB83_9LAMI